MRKLSLLLWIAACTSDRPADRDLHNVAPCPTDAKLLCEQGCSVAATTMPVTCPASNPTVSQDLTCSETFEIDGVRGCCVAINMNGMPVARFFECD